MSVSEFEWEPDSYLAMTLAEIPGYEELQTVADAAQDVTTSSSSNRPVSGVRILALLRRKLDRDRRERGDTRAWA